MTLPPLDFDRFTLDNRKDPYYNNIPSQRLDDLDGKYSGEIKMSLMISTYNRGSQLQRTLETLSRQKFKAFEVLINNSNSTQDIKKIVDEYSKYLNIQYFFENREVWRSCPSSAFKKMLPFTKGNVIVISHPEIMIDYNGLEFVYKAITSPQSVASIADVYTIDKYVSGSPVPSLNSDGRYHWGILRPAFIDEKHQPQLDAVDWHTDLKNIQTMNEFSEFGGLGGQTNGEISGKTEYPWWFVGGTTRDCPVWDEMPGFQGHGIIDMWLCDWRRLNGIVDVLSKETLCYHQPHVTMAIAPEGENLDTSKFARRILK